MALVFLPGMMCDERLFAPQTQVFDLSIVMTSTNRNTIKKMATDVLETAPATFDLAGLSMGGIVAMEIVRLAPERITRLALLDTNHRAEKQVVRLGRLPQIEAVKNGRLMDVMRDEMKPRYLAAGPQKTEILDLCMTMAKELGPAAFINQSIALMDRLDQTETLRSVACPTLVLCGAEDQLCPIPTHRDMAALVPNATLKIIDGAGHLPTLEQPSQTNAALTRWLEVS